MYIFGTYIIPPSKGKKINIMLLQCFGIGNTSSVKILAKLGFNLGLKNKSKNKFKKFYNLKLERFIPFLIRRILRRNLGSFLKNILFLKMKKLRNLKTERAFKHLMCLPVRGQHTKTNARTQKLKRKQRKKISIPKKKK
jgi:small subunit ribosomal protein S13